MSPGSRPSAEGTASMALASTSTWNRHPFPRRQDRTPRRYATARICFAKRICVVSRSVIRIDSI